MKLFGIIGFPLVHSYSSNYFNNKFKAERIKAKYVNFPITKIDDISELIKTCPDLHGLNVTMPYKEKIIPFLDEISGEVEKTGAANVIKIVRKNQTIKLIGYNSDISGFVNSLKPLLSSKHKKALILGTGGAAKAVAYGLSLLDIEYRFVSRFLSEKFYFLML